MFDDTGREIFEIKIIDYECCCNIPSFRSKVKNLFTSLTLSLIYSTGFTVTFISDLILSLGQ